jgi:hypothetical protein
MTTTEPIREQTELHLPALQDLSESIAKLSPLLAAAMAILRITEHDRFSAHELASTIGSDQALTGKLLRLADSAYYGFSRTIGTVRDAVVLLGFRTVRATTLASSVIDTLRGSTHVNYDAFWYHSVCTGMLAEVLARTEGVHQDEAFIGGVLHNIGLMVIDQQRPDRAGGITGVRTPARRQPAVYGASPARLHGRGPRRRAGAALAVPAGTGGGNPLPRHAAGPAARSAYPQRLCAARAHARSIALNGADSIEGVLEHVGDFLDSAS